jgi:LytTr DNA-binding domain
MNALMKWLQQPFPFDEDRTYAARSAMVGGAFVTLFLYFFRPFGMNTDTLSEGEVFWICAQFGLITGAVAVLWGGVVALFPRIFEEKKWSVGREIAATLVFIAAVTLGNLLFSAWKWNNCVTLTNYLRWLGVTASVGVFPTGLGVLLKQVRLMRRYATEAVDISRHLHPTVTTPPTATVTLMGDNQGESLRVAVADFLYAEAADNYVKIVWHEASVVKSMLLRTTLRRVETELQGHAQLYRCHRSYVVNLAEVQYLSGNAQGYKLHLQHTDATVPVSRSLNDEIRVRLGQ